MQYGTPLVFLAYMMIALPAQAQVPAEVDA